MTEMLEFFKKTGSEGGKKAAEGMTPEERKQRARKAGLVGAAARWGNAKTRKARSKKTAAKKRAARKPKGD